MIEAVLVLAGRRSLVDIWSNSPSDAGLVVLFANTSQWRVSVRQLSTQAELDGSPNRHVFLTCAGSGYLLGRLPPSSNSCLRDALH